MQKYDFSGYATKNDLKCSDGRTIKKDAFKHNDGQKVPLVWQHLHNEPDNILGHAILENREDGVYAYGTFNSTKAGENAKQLVLHGDITALSIFANQLKEEGKNVIHGAIKEVSLVLSGANPGAFIDYLAFAHADGTEDISNEEALIYTDAIIEIKHEETKKEEEDGETVQDVIDSMTEKQKNVVATLLADLLAEGAEGEEDEAEHSDEGGNEMKHNAFEQKETATKGAVLTHSDIQDILKKAPEMGSLKNSFMANEKVIAHVATYGIENIDYLFPEARTLSNVPSMISRDMAWVDVVLNGTSHSPFSRIKSVHADITEETARALGYIKGTLKKEEVFKLLKRTTTPTTIYKKQKLDRDDILDITDLDVIAFVKGEMNIMIREELARAAMIGDGRAVDSPDKINDENIRPILTDDDLYAHHVELANDIDYAEMIDEIVKARVFYKGTGNPIFLTDTTTLTGMLLLKDTLGRRIYSTKADLAQALLMKDIIDVNLFAGITRTRTDAKVMTLVGIMVNLSDYKFGADKGGSLTFFDDFDIDYNQYKYLLETRCCGTLTIPKSALVFEKLPAA